MGDDVVISEMQLPGTVQAHLLAVGPGLRGRQVLFLPGKRRGENIWYASDEVYSLADARTVDLDADYLVEGSDRRHLSEYSAVAQAVAFALAVGEGLTATGLAALIKYVWQRVRRRSVDVSQSIEPEDVPVKVTISRVTSADHGPIVKTIQFEGATPAVVEALNQAYGRAIVHDEVHLPEQGDETSHDSFESDTGWSPSLGGRHSAPRPIGTDSDEADD